jgi:hypothetical protein
MHPNHRTNRSRPIAAAAALLLTALLLAACGSSSSSSTASTAAAKAQAGGGAKGFAAVRECLKKAGITLPNRGAGTPGTGRPPGGGAGGFGLGGAGGPALPKGVTREQLQKAFQKCGGASFRRGFGGARLGSSSYRKALVKFSACMAENGVKLPPPNTSGKGPIFNTKGVNANSTKFRAAQQKCSSLIRVAPGTGGPAGAPGGAPGAPAEAPPPGV